MDDSKAEDPKEQAMSSDDMLKEIHSMLKSMVETKQEGEEQEKKAESSTEEEEKKKVESSAKRPTPKYSFNWPQTQPQQKESKLLCDLVN